MTYIRYVTPLQIKRKCKYSQKWKKRVNLSITHGRKFHNKYKICNSKPPVQISFSNFERESIRWKLDNKRTYKPYMPCNIIKKWVLDKHRNLLRLGYREFNDAKVLLRLLTKQRREITLVKKRHSMQLRRL